MSRKWILAIAAVLIVLGIFLVVRMRGGGVEVEVAEVVKGKILSTVAATGLVKADTVRLGSAKMAGRVEWVGVNEGDRVEKGQILVKLDGYDQAEREFQRLNKLHAEGYVSDLELERAKAALDAARVVAPMKGMVVEKSVIAGESISPGMPVMTVVDVDHPWVEIQIDEADIAEVKIGQRVKFTTDAFPGQEFYGRITWINNKAELKKVGGRVRMDEEDMVFRAKVEFEDGKKVLKPGMSVYAEIVSGEKEEVLTVPRAAIFLYGGKTVVYLIKNNRAWQKEVEVGLRDVDKVEILSGLSLGDLVAISNLEKIKDKSWVKVQSK